VQLRQLGVNAGEPVPRKCWRGVACEKRAPPCRAERRNYLLRFAEYFAEDDPFAEFIVQELALVFHNCKPASIGLRETRTKQWLLDIDYRNGRPSRTHAKPTRACSSAESALPND